MTAVIYCMMISSPFLERRINTIHISVQTPLTLRKLIVAFVLSYCASYAGFEESPEEARQITDLCERNDYVKPSVYQGQYSAIVRGGMKELFSLLRKYGMAFGGLS
jgi:hypothetical protein